MNAFTKVSGKGQVVVPKATRDRLGWSVGTDLEVIEAGDTIVLRRRQSEKILSVQEAVARLRSVIAYEGPVVSFEQMKLDAGEAAARPINDK